MSPVTFRVGYFLLMRAAIALPPLRLLGLTAGMCAAAVTVTACSAGGSTESIELGSDEPSLEIYVPSGWHLGDMVATGAVPGGDQSTFYLADEKIISRDLAEQAIDDPGAREEFSGHMSDGGLITIVVSNPQSCSGVADNLQRRIDAHDGTDAVVTEPQGAVGDDGTIVAARDGGFALNAYSASLDLGDGLCRGLLISSTAPEDQAERLAELITDVAAESKLR